MYIYIYNIHIHVCKYIYIYLYIYIPHVSYSEDIAKGGHKLVVLRKNISKTKHVCPKTSQKFL